MTPALYYCGFYLSIHIPLPSASGTIPMLHTQGRLCRWFEPSLGSIFVVGKFCGVRERLRCHKGRLIAVRYSPTRE